MENEVIDWLLEKENPSVRYFTLRHLLKRPASDPGVRTARRAIMRSEPVRKILAAQHAEGYWVKPGAGYSPKYRATDWQILFLAELGADGGNRQVRRGCQYLLDHAPSRIGGFSAAAGATPMGVIHCLNGNLIWALVALGFGEDERVQQAVDWLAGAITGEGFDDWYASGTSGPGFRCAANEKKPCAWGAVKALRALATLPSKLRTPRVRRATEAAAEFLLNRDLAKATYPFPSYGRVSGEWFRFGFPLSYTSDVLEALLALTEAGYGRDKRLKHAKALLLSKRQPDGRWLLKHSLNEKMWADIEVKHQPSKWVTLRALRVLQA